MLEKLLLQIESLQKEARSLRKRNETLEGKVSALEEQKESLVTKLKESKRKNRELLEQIHAYLKRLYGRKSEKIDPNQLLLLYDGEDAKLAEEHPFASEAPDDEEATEVTPKRKRKKRSRAGRQPLPLHLPRERVELEPAQEERTCSCCGEPKTRLGEDVTEELDFRPASFFVREYVRPKYVCGHCADEGVAMADLPARPIDRGRPGPGLLAHILTAKYGDHLPLHRLEGIARREGVELSRSTMCDWIRDAAFHLEPIVADIKRSVLSSHVIQADETPVKMQENWKSGGIRQCRLWSYVGDQGDVVFDFTRTRAGKWPKEFLSEYQGYLQADAYAGYNVLYESGEIVEVGCWAHARRKFHEAMDFEPKEASRPLALIQLLYRVEAKAREGDMEGEALLRLRQEESVPILKALWEELGKLEKRPLEKDPLGKAVNYTLEQWEALGRYINDSKLSIDNNACERTLRAVAVGRKAWLFAGSEAGGKRAALIYSIVETARLHKVNLFEYLRDVFEKVSTHPQSRIFELTPRGWQQVRRSVEQAAQPAVAPT